MAGAGYKLFNTGDVLTAAQVNTYLQEQTVMVFASAAARTTALTGVVAEGMISYLTDTDVVQYYNGTTWTTINTDQTPLTTKGDLFTFSTQDARLAVGSNGETLVADSSTATGLRYTAGTVQANPVLNSAFQIWQRGTSFTATNVYTADRWYKGSAPAATYSRQATGDTTNLPNIQYCARIQRNSGSSATNGIDFGQNFESANSIPFAGKTITMSFYARAGANYSSSSSILLAQLYSGTGTDQNVFTGFTGQVAVISQNATLTTTWQRFSFSATVGATATQLAPYFQYSPTGTAGANDYFEITGVQIDIGSVALPFRTYAATLAGELAACQRYYYKSPEMSVVPGAATSSGLVRGGTNASGNRWIGAFSLPVTMRTSPTCVVYNPNNGTAGQMRNEDANTNVTVSGIFGQYTNTVTQIDFNPTTSANNVVVGYITASAEL